VQGLQQAKDSARWRAATCCAAEHLFRFPI